MMTLPTIETPRYEIKIPSTGVMIEYRPYLVKEEKMLMIAAESKDSKQALKSMKDIIRSCTFDKVNVNKLALFDLEYIFLKLRTKSVGESANVKMKCEKCEHYTSISIDLDSVEIEFTKPDSENYQDKNIRLTSQVGVILQYINIDKMTKLNLDPQSDTDKLKSLNDLVIASIESVYDSDKVYNSDDCSHEELTKFVDSMNRSQVEKIERFMAGTPKLQKLVTFKCCTPECSHQNSVMLTGLQSFFA